MGLACSTHSYPQREVLDALAYCTAQAVQPMSMFRWLRGSVSETLEIEIWLLGDHACTARYDHSKRTGAVLLLTACIEWLTQLHYT